MTLKAYPGPSLSSRTTLRLGGKAMAELVAEQESDLEHLPDRILRLGGKLQILGRGSNILAKDGELPIVLLKLGFKEEPKVLFEEEKSIVMHVSAATPLPRLIYWLGKRGFTGLEGLSGIPGQVGGAVAMNAGSFGDEIGDTLHRVRIFSPEKGIHWLTGDEFSTGYRSFRVNAEPGFFVVTKVELKLQRARQEIIQEKMRLHMARKKASQPVSSWSAGCVFKNPQADAPAGMLLDKAGFKGKQLGGMAFSEMHANFLVNTGAGASAEAFELIAMAQEKVQKQFGYNLEMEVKVCPCN